MTRPGRAIRRAPGLLFAITVIGVSGLLMAAASSAANGHSDPCHTRHACPSDHHSYIWTDATGKGWDCARPGAVEVTAADTTKLTVGGLPYLCHAAGSSAGGSSKPPATATQTTRTASTTTLTTTTQASEEDGGGDTCGVERWAVKVVSDPAAGQIKLTPRPTTVGVLRSLPVPADAYYRTPPVETTVWTVQVRLVAMKVEADSDVHLVIADPATGQTMIVEFPSDGCTGDTLATIRPKLRAARKALLAACGAASSGGFRQLFGSATISGVGFFDRMHGQTGVAPNGIELHPVLSFAGRCSGA